MPRCSATARASYTSSMEQHRPRNASGMPSCPASRRWFHSCSVRPTTVCPCAHSSAATAEESTPPDIATAIVSGCAPVLTPPLSQLSPQSACETLLARRLHIPAVCAQVVIARCAVHGRIHLPSVFAHRHRHMERPGDMVTVFHHEARVAGRGALRRAAVHVERESIPRLLPVRKLAIRPRLLLRLAHQVIRGRILRLAGLHRTGLRFGASTTTHHRPHLRLLRRRHCGNPCLHLRRQRHLHSLGRLRLPQSLFDRARRHTLSQYDSREKDQGCVPAGVPALAEGQRRREVHCAHSSDQVLGPESRQSITSHACPGNRRACPPGIVFRSEEYTA